MFKVEVVLPAYNEAHRIRRTLDHYVRFFDASVHFIVVTNGCTDATAEVVRTMQLKFPERITLIAEPQPIGKGGAILRGWQASTAPVIGFVDADGATSPEEFQRLLDALPPVDGVVASRFLPESQIIDRDSWLRSSVSTLAAQLVHGLYGLPFSDTQCGAKVFKRAALEPILPHLHMHNMLFDVELLWLLHRSGKSIQEVATVWIDQPGSATLGSSWKFLYTAARLFVAVIYLRLRRYPSGVPSEKTEN